MSPSSKRITRLNVGIVSCWHGVLLPPRLPSLLIPISFSLPYLLPATRDLLSTISLLNWEKLSGCSKARKKKLLSQPSNLWTQGYPMVVFVTPTFISKLVLYLFPSVCVCWGAGIPVFLCLKLSIFQLKKVVWRTWALIAVGEILMYPPASFKGGIPRFELAWITEKTYYGQNDLFTELWFFSSASFCPNGMLIFFFFQTGLFSAQMSHSQSSLTPCIIRVKELSLIIVNHASKSLRGAEWFLERCLSIMTRHPVTQYPGG